MAWDRRINLLLRFFYLASSVGWLVPFHFYFLRPSCECAFIITARCVAAAAVARVTVFFSSLRVHSSERGEEELHYRTAAQSCCCIIAAYFQTKEEGSRCMDGVIYLILVHLSFVFFDKQEQQGG